jgi:hypothetical protein
MMTYEEENALTLGAVDVFLPHQVVPYLPAARLSVVLEWTAKENKMLGRQSGMRAPIVRGSPYVTMEYVNIHPRLIGRRSMLTPGIVDHVDGFESILLHCGIGRDNFSEPITVHKELQMTFDVSDFTWILFVSTPMQFVCTTRARPQLDPADALPPGVLPSSPPEEAYFELRAIGSVLPGAVVRLALVNNCTTGINNIHCSERKPTDRGSFVDLLRRHSEVFPTGRADVGFTFPSEMATDESLDMHFNWAATSMSQWHDNLALSISRGGAGFDYDSVPEGPPVYAADSTDVGGRNFEELLMFALPHHQVCVFIGGCLCMMIIYCLH